MRSIAAVALALLTSLTPLVAQPSIVAKFEFRSHTFEGTTIPYRLFTPEPYDPTQVYPVVLSLHGSGERGTDNRRHVNNYRLATAWADPVNQAKHPCFVVAPQCPESGAWTYDFYPRQIGPEMATVVDILDSLLVEFSIDENRQYVTGLSMGGYGTWDLITRFPDRFAAAIPMSAGCDPSLAERIVDTPIWNFHGALDDAVPVNESREMMEALERVGRSALYTHCHIRDCRGMADSVLSVHVKSHADLLYTEYPNGGHIIWDESYDHPDLMRWVFDKYRLVPDAIAVVGFDDHRYLQGTETIRYNAMTGEGSVEIWYSPDRGESWVNVSQSEPNTGAFVWNTENVIDCSFGLLRIFLKDTYGHMYGRDQSHYFTIDNEMNGTPYVKIMNEEFWREEMVDEDSVELKLLIGDAEAGPLHVQISYSPNGGLFFGQFAEYEAWSDINEQYIILPLSQLPNSSQAIIKVQAGDGQLSGMDLTNTFVKHTPRLQGPQANHVAGSSGASITVNTLDPSQLTGHLYRILIDMTTCCPFRKFYSVLDVDRDTMVIEPTPEMDGISEGPAFDGVCLIIKDFDPPVVDLEHTGWFKGQSNLEVSVYLPEINLGTEVLKGTAYPADYLITLQDHIADTSSTAYGAQPLPMYFDVRNMTDNVPADVIFLDNDGNRTLSRLDELFILFGDEGRLTWALLFAGPPSSIPPQPGDEFLLRTLKPLGLDDVYEFRTVNLNPQKADINGDHTVDVSDALSAVSFILHTITPTDEEFWASDCNGLPGICLGDGDLNVLDVIKIINLILGLDECH